jgi:hypothetical protein
MHSWYLHSPYDMQAIGDMMLGSAGHCTTVGEGRQLLVPC